jgi:hypothetical protein
VVSIGNRCQDSKIRPMKQRTGFKSLDQVKEVYRRRVSNHSRCFLNNVHHSTLWPDPNLLNSPLRKPLPVAEIAPV